VGNREIDESASLAAVLLNAEAALLATRGELAAPRLKYNLAQSNAISQNIRKGDFSRPKVRGKK